MYRVRLGRPRDRSLGPSGRRSPDLSPVRSGSRRSPAGSPVRDSRGRERERERERDREQPRRRRSPSRPRTRIDSPVHSGTSGGRRSSPQGLHTDPDLSLRRSRGNDRYLHSASDSLNDQDRDDSADRPIFPQSLSSSPGPERYPSREEQPPSPYLLRHDDDYLRPHSSVPDRDMMDSYPSKRPRYEEQQPSQNQTSDYKGYASGTTLYRRSPSPSLYRHEEIWEQELTRKRGQEEHNHALSHESSGTDFMRSGSVNPLGLSGVNLLHQQKDEVQTVPVKSILKKRLEPEPETAVPRKLGDFSGSSVSGKELASRAPASQSSKPFTSEVENFLNRFTKGFTAGTMYQKPVSSSQTGVPADTLQTNKVVTSFIQKENPEPKQEAVDRQSDFLLPHERASQDGSGFSRILGLADSTTVPPVKKPSTFKEIEDEEKFLYGDEEEVKPKAAQQPSSTPSAIQCLPASHAPQTPVMPAEPPVEESSSKQEYEQIHDLLKTIGLDIGVAEIGKLAVRTQERLHGKKPATHSPERHLPDSRRQESWESRRSRSDTRSPESNHKHSESPLESSQASRDKSAYSNSKYVKRSTEQGTEVGQGIPSTVLEKQVHTIPSTSPTVLTPTSGTQYQMPNYAQYSGVQMPPNYGQHLPAPPTGFDTYGHYLTYASQSWPIYSSTQPPTQQPTQQPNLKTPTNPTRPNLRVIQPIEEAPGAQTISAIPSLLDGISIPPPKRATEIISDEKNKAFQKQKVIVEREKLKTEREIEQKKIAYLLAELESLRKQQGELLRKKRREKDGHKDPLLVKVNRLQDNILKEITELRKQCDILETKQIELDKIAQILGIPILEKVRKVDIKVLPVDKNSRSEKTRSPEKSAVLPKDLKVINEKPCIKSQKPTEPAQKTSTKPFQLADIYDYYDAGNHWCKDCNTISGTLFDFFTHMHNKKHRQTLDPYKRPWAMKIQKEVKGSFKPIDRLTVPAKGAEFLIPITGYYCELCEEFVGDQICAEQHVKTFNHNSKYKKYVDDNPLYEARRNLDHQVVEVERRRQSELKRKLGDKPAEERDKKKSKMAKREGGEHVGKGTNEIETTRSKTECGQKYGKSKKDEKKDEKEDKSKKEPVTITSFGKFTWKKKEEDKRRGVTAASTKWDGTVGNKVDKDKEKAREEKAREERVREEKAREERAREEKAREERAREEKAREERAREEKAKEERAREEKAKEERAREEKAKEERARAEKAKEERARAEKAKEERARTEKAKEEKAREEKAKEEKAREEKAKEEKAREEKAREEKAKEESKAQPGKQKGIEIKLFGKTVISPISSWKSNATPPASNTSLNKIIKPNLPIPPSVVKKSNIITSSKPAPLNTFLSIQSSGTTTKPLPVVRGSKTILPPDIVSKAFGGQEVTLKGTQGAPAAQQKKEPIARPPPVIHAVTIQSDEVAPGVSVSDQAKLALRVPPRTPPPPGAIPLAKLFDKPTPAFVTANAKDLYGIFYSNIGKSSPDPGLSTSFPGIYMSGLKRTSVPFPLVPVPLVVPVQNIPVHSTTSMGLKGRTQFSTMPTKGIVNNAGIRTNQSQNSPLIVIQPTVQGEASTSKEMSGDSNSCKGGMETKAVELTPDVKPKVSQTLQNTQMETKALELMPVTSESEFNQKSQTAQMETKVLDSIPSVKLEASQKPQETQMGTETEKKTELVERKVAAQSLDVVSIGDADKKTDQPEASKENKNAQVTAEQSKSQSVKSQQMTKVETNVCNVSSDFEEMGVKINLCQPRVNQKRTQDVTLKTRDSNLTQPNSYISGDIMENTTLHTDPARLALSPSDISALGTAVKSSMTEATSLTEPSSCNTSITVNTSESIASKDSLKPQTPPVEVQCITKVLELSENKAEKETINLSSGQGEIHKSQHAQISDLEENQISKTDAPIQLEAKGSQLDTSTADKKDEQTVVKDAQLEGSRDPTGNSITNTKAHNLAETEAEISQSSDATTNEVIDKVALGCPLLVNNQDLLGHSVTEVKMPKLLEIKDVGVPETEFQKSELSEINLETSSTTGDIKEQVVLDTQLEKSQGLVNKSVAKPDDQGAETTRQLADISAVDIKIAQLSSQAPLNISLVKMTEQSGQAPAPEQINMTQTSKQFIDVTVQEEDSQKTQSRHPLEVPDLENTVGQCSNLQLADLETKDESTPETDLQLSDSIAPENSVKVETLDISSTRSETFQESLTSVAKEFSVEKIATNSPISASDTNITDTNITAVNDFDMKPKQPETLTLNYDTENDGKDTLTATDIKSNDSGSLKTDLVAHKKFSLGDMEVDCEPISIPAAEMLTGDLDTPKLESVASVDMSDTADNELMNKLSVAESEMVDFGTLASSDQEAVKLCVLISEPTNIPPASSGDRAGESRSVQELQGNNAISKCPLRLEENKENSSDTVEMPALTCDEQIQNHPDPANIKVTSIEEGSGEPCQQMTKVEAKSDELTPAIEMENDFQVPSTLSVVVPDTTKDPAVPMEKPACLDQ